MMTVEGLKPGTTYVFRVRARTDGGYGSYGGEIELETSHEGKARNLVGTLTFFFFFLQLGRRYFYLGFTITVSHL